MAAKRTKPVAKGCERRVCDVCGKTFVTETDSSETHCDFCELATWPTPDEIGPRLPTPQEAYQAYCNAAADLLLDPDPRHGAWNVARHWAAMALWMRVDPTESARIAFA